MNMYDHPEKFGLQLVGMVDRSDGNYRFDMFVIWRHGRKLCYGTDDGCSCPENFEGRGIDTLTYGRKTEVVKALKEWAAPVNKDHESSHIRDEQSNIDAKVVELIAKL